MSLINEALKRTRDASYQTAAAPTAPAPSYRLGNTAETRAFSAKGAMVLTIAVITIALGTVGVVAFRRVAPIHAVHEALISTAPETTPPPPVTEPVPIVPNVLPAIESAAPSPPAPTREAPKLVLQGITIDGAVREAMINGFNLREGEDIEGARIVAIESRRVTLQFDGREIVLRMP
jgi:hypothetical protein